MQINLQCDLWQIAWRKNILHILLLLEIFINYSKLLIEIKHHWKICLVFASTLGLCDLILGGLHRCLIQANNSGSGPVEHLQHPHRNRRFDERPEPKNQVEHPGTKVLKHLNILFQLAVELKKITLPL